MRFLESRLPPRQATVWAFLFLVSAISPGCATFHYVASHQPAGCKNASGQSLQGVQQVRVSVWPFQDEVDYKKVDSAKCSADPCAFECVTCHGRGFAEVTVQTNWLFSFVSVVTLGVVTPVKVTYICAGDA